jgi:hypothetical protein
MNVTDTRKKSEALLEARAGTSRRYQNMKEQMSEEDKAERRQRYKIHHQRYRARKKAEACGQDPPPEAALKKTSWKYGPLATSLHNTDDGSQGQDRNNSLLASANKESVRGLNCCSNGKLPLTHGAATFSQAR